jgi:hypothetical protein
MDTDAPIRDTPNKEIADAIRAKLRTETVAPSSDKSNTEIEEPSASAPLIATDAPKREKLLSDRVAPSLELSTTDTEAPMREQPSRATAEPKRA